MESVQKRQKMAFAGVTPFKTIIYTDPDLFSDNEQFFFASFVATRSAFADFSGRMGAGRLYECKFSKRAENKRKTNRQSVLPSCCISRVLLHRSLLLGCSKIVIIDQHAEGFTCDLAWTPLTDASSGLVWLPIMKDETKKQEWRKVRAGSSTGHLVNVGKWVTHVFIKHKNCSTFVYGCAVALQSQSHDITIHDITGNRPIYTRSRSLDVF